MPFIALRMLFGDKAKYFGIILGVTLTSMVITQQGSVFVGLMSRTFALVSDMPQADIWVMDEKVQFIDDVKPLQDTELFRVRSIEGVAWAVPLYKASIRARLENGVFQNCQIVGIDDASLVGGPAVMLEGQLSDLRRADAVIVDVVGARTRLAKPPPAGSPKGTPNTPLKVGDTLELNDNRAVVVGICRTTRPFNSQPTIYTTYNRATTFAPRERKLLSFVLVKAQPGQDPQELCDRISKVTGMAAYTSGQFKWKTVSFFINNTGIPINFGIAVGLGFVIGTLITGFMFYNFTLDNLRYFGTLKAMGATDGKLLSMVMLQACLVAVIGYGLGVGAATTFGWVMRNTPLAWRTPWQLLIISGAAVIVISMIAAMLSMRRVFTLEPAVVFKG
jgi:putative ABC transport system permease protein